MEHRHRDDARPSFPLGRIVATPGALDLLDRHAINAIDLLWRHQHGDWGKVPVDDAVRNDEAARSGERVLSSYPIGGETIWVITEADRTVTTLLLPSEY